MALSLSTDQEKKIDEIVGRYPTKRAACIPVLHVCQAQVGWVSADVIAWVAQRLGMATSEVQGVVTFYTMYHQAPVKKHVLWVCRTLSCDLRGGKAIQEHVEKRFGCHAGEDSANGVWSLKKAECLAGCGYAPMVQIDDRFFENLTPEALDAVIDAYEKGTPPPQAETAWTKNPAPPKPSAPPPAAPAAPTPSTPPSAPQAS
jgi:NADH-quinone oxidoreductase subunit E